MTSKPRILVVEEDPSELETLIRALSPECFEVVRAATSAEALSCLAEPIDMIIAGIPMTGFHALELLQNWMDCRPTVPFIVVTDVDGIHLATDAMKLGAMDHVVKPIHPDQLRVRITKWLENARRDERLRQLESQIGDSSSPAVKPVGVEIPPGTSLDELERAAITKALEQHLGNRTHAARTLGISVRTLQRKLKTWRISNQSKRLHVPTNNFFPTHAAAATNGFSAPSQVL